MTQSQFIHVSPTVLYLLTDNQHIAFPITNYFIRCMTVEMHMRLEQKRKIYDKVITGFDLIFVLNNEFSIGMAYTYITLRNIDRFDKQ